MESPSTSTKSPSAEFAGLWNNAMISEGLNEWTTFHVEKPVQLGPLDPVKPKKSNRPYEVGMSTVNPRSRVVRKPRGVVYSDEDTDVSPQKKIVSQRTMDENAAAAFSGAITACIAMDGQKKGVSDKEVSIPKQKAIELVIFSSVGAELQNGAATSGSKKNGITKAGSMEGLRDREVSASKKAAKKKLGIFASKRDIIGKQPVEPRYDLRTRTSTSKSDKCGIRRRTAHW